MMYSSSLMSIAVATTLSSMSLFCVAFLGATAAVATSGRDVSNRYGYLRKSRAISSELGVITDPNNDSTTIDASPIPKRRSLLESAISPTEDDAHSSNNGDGYNLRLDQGVLLDPNGPLKVSFKLPSPSSSLAMVDHKEWRIGIYSHGEADEPLTSINLCGELTCLHKDILHDGSLVETSVTFDESSSASMTGEWPLIAASTTMAMTSGVVFDVYLIDEVGSPVVGPASFTIPATAEVSRGSLTLFTNTVRQPDEALEVFFELPELISINSGEVVSRDHSSWRIGIWPHNEPNTGALSAPLTSVTLCGLDECFHDDYMGAIGHDGSQEEASVLFNNPEWQNSLLLTDRNGDSVDFNLYLVDENNIAILGPTSFTFDHTDNLANVEDEIDDEIEQSYFRTEQDYRFGEPIEIEFTVGADLDYNDEAIASWKIGIFMRMEDPQDGTQPPIVSMPICGKDVCTVEDVSSHQFSVVFRNENRNFIEGHWPMSILKYGTGYDVYVLNETGGEVFGPAMFTVIESEAGSM